jgi:hypothetical protein
MTRRYAQLIYDVKCNVARSMKNDQGTALNGQEHAGMQPHPHCLWVYVSGKSLALIGNASGQGAEGARNCSEAFSIRRLEGRRWQWWALLWS